MEPNTKSVCKFCLYKIKKDAIVCSNCNHYQKGLSAFVRNTIGLWIPLLGAIVALVALGFSFQESKSAQAAASQAQDSLEKSKLAATEAAQSLATVIGLKPNEDDWEALTLGSQFYTHNEYIAASFFIDSLGKVHLRGSVSVFEPEKIKIKKDVVVLKLPSKITPENQHIFSVSCVTIGGLQSGPCSLIVKTSGKITIVNEKRELHSLELIQISYYPK